MNGLLIGYGSIGRRHLANFHALGVTDWAVVHTGQGTLPFEPPGPVNRYTDLSVALREEQPSFAIIANPTNLHLPTALACIEAGSAVLIEKPVSDSVDGLDALAAAAASRDARALVGFQFRFHPALQRIGQILRDRELGAPLHARVVWGEYLPAMHPWEDWRGGYAARRDLGGGVHHTICHPFDYLRMLFGDPTSMIASLTQGGPLGLDVAEAAEVILHFPDGVAAQVHLDFWSQPATHRLEVTCVDGSIRWDYLAGEFEVWDHTTAAWQSESYPGVAERNDLFVAEAHHFLDVVSGEAEPICTLADGIEVVRLCAAMEQTAASEQS